MRAQDFATLPEPVRHAIIDAWLQEECSNAGGVSQRKLLEHSEECPECRDVLLRRFVVFLTVNVDCIIQELMPSQSNPWMN
jgi:hypothetical protein